MERFAGNCASICDDPAISTDLKAACDAGSFNFCAKDAEQNIATPNCKSYLDRVVGTYNAQRTGATHANPVRFPVGSTLQISNYYNEMGIAVAKYGSKDIGRISGQDTADLAKILRDNNPTFATETIMDPLLISVGEYCATASPTSTICSETAAVLPWTTRLVQDNIPKLTEQLSVAATGSVVAVYESDAFKYVRMLHKKFPTTFLPIEKVISSRLSKSDLSLPFLVELRSYSPNLQTSIDTFVINLINGSKNSFSQEKLSDSSVYDISLVDNGMLYDADIQKYLSNIMTFRSNNNLTANDPFVALVLNTNLGNAQLCSTSNPFTTPICTQMSALAGTAASKSINDVMVAFCSNNVADPNCPNYINSNLNAFDANSVNNKMLAYCLTTGIDDTKNCKPFSSITGSADWLKQNTSNTIASDGSIAAVCGTTDGLSKDTCQKVCSVYPELCATDTQQKCSLPTNRYSSNTDYFEEKETYSPDEFGMDLMSNTIYILLAFIGLLILFGVVMSFKKPWSQIPSAIDSSMEFDIGQSSGSNSSM